jgi:hypothetical protein
MVFTGLQPSSRMHGCCIGVRNKRKRGARPADLQVPGEHRMSFVRGVTWLIGMLAGFLPALHEKYCAPSSG